MSRKNKNKSKKNIHNINNNMNVLKDDQNLEKEIVENEVTSNENTFIQNLKENQESQSDASNEINIINEIKDETEKKITLYLINELEKKNFYISELENVIKNQEEEIIELNNKITSINQVDLLIKLKNNVENKLKSDDLSIKKNNGEQIYTQKSSIIEIENIDENDNKSEILKQRRRGLRRF